MGFLIGPPGAKGGGMYAHPHHHYGSTYPPYYPQQQQPYQAHPQPYAYPYQQPLPQQPEYDPYHYASYGLQAAQPYPEPYQLPEAQGEHLCEKCQSSKAKGQNNSPYHMMPNYPAYPSTQQGYTSLPYSQPFIYEARKTSEQKEDEQH